MKIWYIGLVLVFVVGVLAGCGGGEATSTSADEDVSVAYVSEALDASYENALSASSQLVLGTLLLEGTENVVTPEQAAALLPLWQVIQGGSLQGEAEIDAVLTQIEGEMTAEQLAAIAGKQLTSEDQQAWAQEQGLGFGAGDGSGLVGDGEAPSEEERAERMAEMGLTEDDMPAGMGEMSTEEREALRATAEAGGMAAGDRAGAGFGRASIVLDVLIEMLTQRAAE
ncbi:MAG: hypothetical protein SXV54_22270 [Chloroflexota bacterium]|nr:hypothetical protein [Chloroflexota bacterium]